jgi:hypothetical protein
MAERPVECVSVPVERDRLIRQMIVGSPLHFDCQMIPGIALRVAGDARRSPHALLIIKNVPLVPAGQAALVAKDESHIVEKLVDVKLQSLWKTEIVSVEVDVVSEVMQGRHQLLICVRQALRRGGPDQVVVPQPVRERSLSSDIKFRGVTAHRRRTDVLAHPERDSVAGGRRTVDEVGRTLPVLAPAAAVLQMRERICVRRGWGRRRV